MVTRPVHSIILDASPILNNTPTISSLLTKCEKLYTVPSIINEIKDVNARSRLETTILPFLTIRSPKPESIEFVSGFSRKTGDYTVLSQPDIQILALAYELDCEQNAGDWRLRKNPGQKGLNGPSPKRADSGCNRPRAGSSDPQVPPITAIPSISNGVSLNVGSEFHAQVLKTNVAVGEDRISENVDDPQSAQSNPEDGIITQPHPEEVTEMARLTIAEPSPDVSESDSDGWITPSNLKKRQAEDQNASMVAISDDEVMQVATITGDFAMQVST